MSSETDNQWCFQCGNKYELGTGTCPECAVELVDEEPLSVEDVGTTADPQVAYELHPWSFEARRSIEGMLTSANLVHAWQGASLIVLEQDEEQIDALIEEVERSMLPTLDADLEHVVYEMEGWMADMQSDLSSRLGMRGIPHEFNKEGDLVTHEEDEEEIDAIVDDMTSGVKDDEIDEDAIELEGLETNELLTRVFVACQKLARNPLDNFAIIAFMDDVDTIERLRTPFGLDRAAWKPIVANVSALREMYEGEVADLDDDEATQTAAAIKTALHQLV